MQTQEITHSTPLALVTVGQLLELMSKAPNTEQPTVEAPQIGFGYACIEKEFGCCRTTAWRLAKTILKPAISQHGRKITVDLVMARKLFKTGGKI